MYEYNTVDAHLFLLLLRYTEMSDRKVFQLTEIICEAYSILYSHMTLGLLFFSEG